MAVFADRADGGRQLAVRLEQFRGKDVVVFGLPRGGVPVAFEVAEHLKVPLDVIIVRKLGFPAQPEVAMGAIGEGDARTLDSSFLARGMVSRNQLAAVERQERSNLAARVALLRAGRARIDIEGRIAVVVDDGIATGATMSVACAVARQSGAAEVVAAAPVIAAQSIERLAADQVISVLSPSDLFGVGAYYRDFSQTTDDEVVALLGRAAR